ncbi:MAG TPA: TolC family protein [Kiritimatiellia bacterium]|nr:TolC family protein [Kiritimatiellia bacterium]HSA17910.1 TolC family protein [Kiritimatiellia bacterium]
MSVKQKRSRGWVAAGLLVLNSAAAAAAVTVDEAIRAALDASPDLQAVEARVDAARAMQRQARSAYYPWVDVSTQYGISDNPPQAFMMTLNQRQLNMQDPAFNPNQPDDTENLRGSVALKWRLYDSGRRGADNRMAGLGAEAAGEMLSAARNQLIHEVTRGCHGALQARAFAAVQEEAVASIEASLRAANARFEAGSAVKTDVLNLETQLAQAREDLIRARNGLLLAVAALNTAIGRDLVTEDNLEEGAEPPEEKCAAPDPSAVENRPELAAARRMVRVREQALSKARREYGPALNAFASSDWDSDASSDFEQSYTVGVMAELNVFDGFRSRGAVAAARAELDAARAEEAKAERNLRLDLTQAYLGAKEAHERMEVTRKSLESAREALRITREQYEQGAADVALLLQAQVGVTAMRTRAVAAEYDYVTARSNLDRAMGKLVGRYFNGPKEN